MSDLDDSGLMLMTTKNNTDLKLNENNFANIFHCRFHHTPKRFILGIQLIQQVICSGSEVTFFVAAPKSKIFFL